MQTSCTIIFMKNKTLYCMCFIISFMFRTYYLPYFVYPLNVITIDIKPIYSNNFGHIMVLKWWYTVRIITYYYYYYYGMTHVNLYANFTDKVEHETCYRKVTRYHFKVEFHCKSRMVRLHFLVSDYVFSYYTNTTLV